MEAKYRDTVSLIVGWGHWFTFYNVLIALIAGVYYAKSGGWPTGIVDNLYLLTFTVGHFALLLFTGFIVFLFPLAFVLPFWRLYRTICILAATFAQALLMLDCLFYNRLGMHSNSLLYELLYYAGGEQMGVTWWKAAVAVLILLCVEIALANWISRWRKSRSRQVLGKQLAQFFFGCFFIYNFAYAAADAIGREGIIRQQEFYPLAYPLTAKTALKRWGLYSEDTNLPEGELNVRFHYPKQPLTAKAEKTPDIIMVVVSSLRADMLNPTNMPYSTELARQSLWASRYYSSGQGKEEGMFGLLYGIPATYAKAAEYSQTQPVLTHWLQEQGYQLSLFSSYEPSKDASLYQGFNQDYVPEHKINAAIADTATLHHWHQHYQQHQDQADFYLINLAGVERYATPPGFSNPFQPDLEGVLLLEEDALSAGDALLNRYRNAVLHTDQLINFITSQVDLESNIVILTSDHGRFFAKPNQELSSDFHPSQVQVPFLMAGQGIKPRVAGGLASHYDVSATLIQHLTNEVVAIENFSSGSDLQQPDTRSDWLLLGRKTNFALIEADRLTRVRKFGDYQIFNNIMTPQPQTKMRVAPMLQAVKEMHRYGRK